MINYLEDWNKVINYVEGLTFDILDIVASSSKSNDEKEADIKYYIAVYSIMLLNNFSLNS